MNGLATRISRSQSDILAAEQRIEKLARRMMIQRVRASLLQAKLDERTRVAYMAGGAPILYLLTATSAADAASRMSFLTEMNRRDAVLAVKVQEATDHSTVALPSGSNRAVLTILTLRRRPSSSVTTASTCSAGACRATSSARAVSRT